MDFSMTEIQEVFKSTAKKFFDEKCTTSALAEFEKSENQYSPSFYKELADLGFLGLVVPEEYGGIDGDLMDLSIIVEEAGKAMFSAPFISSLVTGVLPILNFGTKEQKKKLLPQIIEGQSIVTGALVESQAHYDLSYVKAQAIKNGDGYMLNGTKLFVKFAQSADYFLTLARTDSKEEGSKEGLSLFLVKNDATIKKQALQSIGSDSLFEVEFQNLQLKKTDLLGIENEGWAAVDKINQLATALQCVEMAGLLRRALDLTSNYVKERTQFNRPIGSFQSVQHRLADIYTIVEGGQLAALQAVWRLNEGLSAEKEIAVAKAWLCKEGQKVLVGTHQLHGGMGIDMDYPLQFAFRRFKSMEVELGSAPIQLKKIASTFKTNKVAEVIHS